MAENPGSGLVIIHVSCKHMKHIHTKDAPAAIGPYSQAVATDSLLFISGQIAISPRSGEICGSTGSEQMSQCLENLRAILAADGLGLSDVVKTTIFVVNMDEFADINRVYQSAFGDHKPARSTVGVGSLPRGVLVEIEAVATRA